MSLVRRLLGEPPLPAELREVLTEGEDVLGIARTGGGHVAVTQLGLWLPSDDGPRRVGWHLVSKAVWQGGVLTVTEARESGQAGRAMVLVDCEPVDYPLARPARVPHLVRQRVESSIRARYRKDLAGGGAWFVLRKLPGTDGVVLQVRPDPGTDPELVGEIAEEAAEKLAQPPS